MAFLIMRPCGRYLFIFLMSELPSTCPEKHLERIFFEKFINLEYLFGLLAKILSFRPKLFHFLPSQIIPIFWQLEIFSQLGFMNAPDVRKNDGKFEGQLTQPELANERRKKTIF